MLTIVHMLASEAAGCGREIHIYMIYPILHSKNRVTRTSDYQPVVDIDGCGLTISPHWFG